VTRTSIHEYVAAQRLRYLQASRRVKRRMLDEVVTVTGYHRKAALRRLHHPPRTTPRAARIGRPRVYGPDVTAAAQVLWEASGEIGAVRLQPFVPELLDRLRAFDALRLTPETAAALHRVSAATLKRLLAPIRATRPPRGLGVTRAGTWLKHQIPIRTFAEWDDARPGFLEGDLVAHCGPTTLGFYLCTLCAVDIVTGWTELEASGAKARSAWAARSIALASACRCPCSAGIAIRAPSSSTRPSGATASARASPLLGAAPTARTIAPTSSRRNGAVVRRWVGYDRFTTKPAYAALHAVYRLLRLHVNFFQPVQKLVTRVRVGPRVRRVYDRAQTPYQRLCATGVLKPEAREALDRLYHSLNPLQLRRQLDTALERLWALAAPAPPLPSGISAMIGPESLRTIASGSTISADAIPGYPPAAHPEGVPPPAGNRHL
jgi:hypothetical protein